MRLCVFLALMPRQEGFSSRELMYIQKSSGERTHPCLTPLLMGNGSDRPSIVDTTVDCCSYAVRIVRRVFPPMPAFAIAYHRPACQTESYAFLKSRKAAHVLFFLCLLNLSMLGRVLLL